MSMSTWLNDAQPFSNGENGAFNPASDPSMGYLQTPPASSFDFNQSQTQQMQYRMHNGTAHNGSPAPHNAMYQTHATIPSKRPRPREDSIGASPRQYPGMLPVSRSQTPQGAYPGFPGAVNGGPPYPGSAPFPQYGQASGNTSQSPTMQHQTYNPQIGQHRVQTMSPSSFSPGLQNLGTQGSPSHSEHGSRVNTPQNGTQQYPQGMSFGGGAGQPFTPPVGSALNSAPPSQFGQHTMNHQQQQQMMHEARMRQMQTANGAIPQRLQPQGGSLNPLGQPTGNVANYQAMAQLRGQQPPQTPQRLSGVDDLLRNIAQYMQQRGMPFNANPVIAGKAISSVQLFVGVVKMGGSRRVTAASQWPHVAQLLGLPSMLSGSVAKDLQVYWERNLGSYEAFWMQQQQQRQQQQQQNRQQAIGDSMRGANSAQGIDRPIRADALSASKQMRDQAPQLMRPPSSMRPPYQTSVKQAPSPETDTRQALQNGYANLQEGQMPTRQGSMYNLSRSNTAQHPSYNVSKQPRPGPLTDRASGRSGAKLEQFADVPNRDDPSTWTPRVRELPDFHVPVVSNLDATLKLEPVEAQRDVLDSTRTPTDNATTLKDETIYAVHHGGLPIANPNFNGNIEALLKYKLTVPRIEELGEVDIRAITLSLRSGIHGEVRLALDTIASLSVLPKPPSLDQCDDLVETLIECANDQIDFLAEHATEVSDVILINPYEETVRGCKVENETLQDISAFGTIDHELDRAVDKLICITTILRNFSFSQDSHHSLADPMVLRMMATVMRNMGTRNMMLRTHRNALDFSKDVVIFLSQIAYRLDISAKDEAFCVAHFLVSFAPLPEPNGGENQAIAFSSYSASHHRYLPHAIDSMAKLLARDPNRTLFRSIFAADMSSSPPFDLLTRAFGLAISPVPGPTNLDPIITVKKRAAFLAQGLLAADQLIGMIPSSEHQLARSWMNSQDGFAMKMMKLTSLLARRIFSQPLSQAQSQHQRHREASAEHYDPDGFGMIASRGLMLLKKLADRAKDSERNMTGFPPGVLPTKQNVLAAMGAMHTSPDLIRQLCLISGID